MGGSAGSVGESWDNIDATWFRGYDDHSDIIMTLQESSTNTPAGRAALALPPATYNVNTRFYKAVVNQCHVRPSIFYDTKAMGMMLSVASGKSSDVTMADVGCILFNLNAPTWIPTSLDKMTIADPAQDLTWDEIHSTWWHGSTNGSDTIMLLDDNAPPPSAPVAEVATPTVSTIPPSSSAGNESTVIDGQAKTLAEKICHFSAAAITGPIDHGD